MLFDSCLSFGSPIGGKLYELLKKCANLFTSNKDGQIDQLFYSTAGVAAGLTGLIFVELWWISGLL